MRRTNQHKMASAVLRQSRCLRKLKPFKRENVARHAQLDNHRNFNKSCQMLGVTKVNFPSLSPSMEKGDLLKWHIKEGDSITAGGLLLEIKTDKADIDVEAEEDGILAKILYPEGSTDIPVSTVIALMVEEGEDWQNVEIPEDAEASRSETTSTTEAAPETASSSAETGGHGLWPSVKKLLEEYKINPDDVSGSGAHGTILKGDVLKFINTKNLQRTEIVSQPLPTPVSSPAPIQSILPPSITSSAPDGDDVAVNIPMSNMRKIIAKRLTESKSTIPHAYISIECDVGTVQKYRKEFASEDNVKVSVNDFIVKAAAYALQRVPAVNAVWNGDVCQHASSVDISIAVATEAGLITPIVKNADTLGIAEISSTIRELAGRAKLNKLKPQEFQGGTFTISNLGMFGISEFTAVINPPQTAILAVGTSRLEPGVDGQPCSMMTVQMSFDGRAITEIEASLFLEAFKSAVEEPNLVLAGATRMVQTV